MNRYISYFHYWFSAKRRHRIHSPFVYELSDKCLSTPIKDEHALILKNQFNVLSKNQNSISVSDFGAGSKVMGNQRKISEIFRNSRSSKRYASLLYQLCAHYRPNRILEFGTSLGWGTLHMHLGNSTAMIDTVEGCPQIFNKAKMLFPIQSDKIVFHNMTFEDFLKQLQDVRYDFIFIDGNHRGNALLEYVNRLYPFSHHDTIWVLDDIRWSDGMWQAWESVVDDKRFHVSIDFMRMGILLRRETQEKEHFYLK